MVAQAFKADCGCEATVIKWSSKRNVLSMTNCPLHKAAKELLDAARAILNSTDYAGDERPLMHSLRSAADKAEGRP